MNTFSNIPFTRIIEPNCSNPAGIQEKIYQSKTTGEIFKYIWRDGGWDIFELAQPDPCHGRLCSECEIGGCEH